MASPSCLCNVQIGSFNTNLNGVLTNDTILCFGDQLSIIPAGDFIPPDSVSFASGITYNPGISFLLYSCLPDYNLQPFSDPCFLGLLSNNNLNLTNDQSLITTFPGVFTDNKIFIVPITMYSIIDGFYSVTNTTDDCYELGAAFSYTLLPEVTTVISSENCTNGTSSVLIQGGDASIFGSDFKASNLLPSNAYFVDSVAIDSTYIIVGGLTPGDFYSYNIKDNSNCNYTVSAGPFGGINKPILSSSGPFCISDSTQALNVNSIVGSWSSNCGNCIDSLGIFYPGNATVGNNSIYYEIDTGTCVAKDSIDIIVSDYVNPTINPVQDICLDEASFHLTASETGGIWSGSGVNQFGLFDPSINGIGTYNVYYVINNVCIDSAIAQITVKDDGECHLLIPSIFSPNNDGVNDIFEIIGINQFEKNSITIINRWGTSVYQKDGYTGDWNGTGLSGKKLPSGTYYYILDLGNGSEPINGYIELIK